MISRRDLLLAPMAAGLIASPLSAAVRFDRQARGFDIARGVGDVASILIDPADHKGVLRAAGDLSTDIGRVTGTPAALLNHPASGPAPRRAIIVGSLDSSPLIRALAQAGKIDTAAVRGKWEAYSLQTVTRPLPGIDEALVIVGADKRGTIYGIYDLSQNIGVSPWYWWADVPVTRRTQVRVAYGKYVQGSPAVRYRGIFLNNEAPCLSGWTAEKFGGMNADFYTRVFELLLRLRANYLWPAMWGNAFNIDDPRNGVLADEYGIVMGTSHHEPMNRAHREWTSNRLGNGEWNYATNKVGVQQFFREGAKRSKDRELVVTMGMRGDGDVALASTGGIESDVRLLETVIADQRQLLREETGKPVETIPQVWVVFTEVQKYYDAGLTLPGDVTVMFSDDNVGYIRRLPTPEERAARPGGFGVYHHMDMNGGPYSYKWTNTNPFPKIWEQMNLALDRGADRIWITNIGDLKPLELPIEFFLAMAWDPKAVAKDRIAAWTEGWAAREFGAGQAKAIAGFVSRYAKYNAWRKPELVKPDVFSLDHYREWERVVGLWTTLRDEAEAVYVRLRPDQRDAYYQLVLHPVRGSANLAEMNAAAARNARFATQGRASTNAEAAEVRRLFAEAHRIRDYYNHELAGGKWNHLMDQSYIGYFDWYQPNQDIMPAISSLDLTEREDFGFAVEGMSQAWPGYYLPPRPPMLNSLTRRSTFIDVFPRGTRPIAPVLSADRPWIRITPDKAFSVDPFDRRFRIDIDWAKVPEGESTGTVSIANGKQTERVSIMVVRATAEQARAAANAWGGIGEAFAIPADGFRRNVPTAAARWDAIPDYGRVGTAMSIFPTTASSVGDPAQAPRLEYDVFLDKAGDYQLDLVTGATLRVDPRHRLAVAAGIDDLPMQVRTVFTPEEIESQEFLGRAHGEHARADCRTISFTLNVPTAGRHILKIAMVDPTIVLQSIIVSNGRNLPKSYFGPPVQSTLRSPAPDRPVSRRP